MTLRHLPTGFKFGKFSKYELFGKVNQNIPVLVKTVSKIQVLAVLGVLVITRNQQLRIRQTWTLKDPKTIGYKSTW
jgi:hypothetical protein